MNDNIDYATMIEIPVSTAEITVKKPRLFKRKRHEALKQELIDKVNEEETVEEISEPACEFADTVEITTKKQQKKKVRDKKFSFDVITAQVAVIIVLALTIMLTSIFWKDSGINTLIRSVFANDAKAVADTTYSEFTPQIPSSANVTLESGIMTFAGGSVYSLCDGKVTKVAENAGKYDITIQYSPSFTALISGAEYAYYGAGESVYKALPVCYSSSGVKMCLYNDGKLLTDYIIDNGKIVWQS